MGKTNSVLSILSNFTNVNPTFVIKINQARLKILMLTSIKRLLFLVTDIELGSTIEINIEK